MKACQVQSLAFPALKNPLAYHEFHHSVNSLLCYPGNEGKQAEAGVLKKGSYLAAPLGATNFFKLIHTLLCYSSLTQLFYQTGLSIRADTLTLDPHTLDWQKNFRRGKTL
jgi:hypothetical protein